MATSLLRGALLQGLRKWVEVVRDARAQATLESHTGTEEQLRRNLQKAQQERDKMGSELDVVQGW